MTTVVYTACYGGYDQIHAPAGQDVDVEFVCFTDTPHLDAPGWQTQIEPARYDTARMAAKFPKMRPDLLLGDGPSIWVDANMEITSPAFAREALAAMHAGFAVWTHPHRDCIYDEAAASLVENPAKYGHQPLDAQADHYRREGHPEHGGLYACGTLARDTRLPLMRAHGRMWLAECERWSDQDQVSFPVVCRRLSIRPGVFPHRQIGSVSKGVIVNPWMRLHRHLSRA